MITNDALTRFIFEKTPVRGELIRLEETFQTIINQHKYPPALKQLLGEALCVAGLLSAIIKFKGRLSVQFRGKGGLKLLTAQCDNDFNLRALVKWEGMLTYDDLMVAFNDGILAIILDPQPGKGTRYEGIVSWRGNSLVESIEGYFRESEQLNTKISLAVNETNAAGFLLQVVPTKEHENSTLEQLSTSPHWKRIADLTSGLVADDLLHAEHQALLRTLYPNEEVRVFTPVRVGFKCPCTRKRGEDAILVLGQKEAAEELKDKNTIVVTCDFCNKEYVFDRVDVAKIFQGHGTPPNQQLH